MKLFIDTNILIDLLAKREHFYEEASILFSLAEVKKVSISVSALTIANTNYLLSKSLNKENVDSILRKILMLVNILPLDSKIIQLALENNNFMDYEDALQYYTALEHNQEIIITRNLKDFKHSQLPVMTAKQFLELKKQ